jgi:hypothetical protein
VTSRCGLSEVASDVALAAAGYRTDSRETLPFTCQWSIFLLCNTGNRYGVFVTSKLVGPVRGYFPYRSALCDDALINDICLGNADRNETLVRYLLWADMARFSGCVSALCPQRPCAHPSSYPGTFPRGGGSSETGAWLGPLNHKVRMRGAAPHRFHTSPCSCTSLFEAEALRGQYSVPPVTYHAVLASWYKGTSFCRQVVADSDWTIQACYNSFFFCSSFIGRSP